MNSFPGVRVGRVPRMTAPYKGLYQHATLVDVARGVSRGVEVEFPPAAGSGLWSDDCGDTAQNGVKGGGGGAPRGFFPGTAVWAGVECALPGLLSDEVEADAAAALRAVEEGRAEEHLNSVLGAVDAPEVVAGVDAGVAVVRAAGWRPVVLMPPAAAAVAMRDRVVHWSQGGPVTLTGDPVVVTAAVDGVWVVGDVYVWRSPVDVYEATDTSSNTRLVVAERTLAVGWAGPATRVEEGG